MARGNIFTMMINDGKQDALLTASEKLLDKLRIIEQVKLKECTKKWQTYFNNPPNPMTLRYRTLYAKWVDDSVSFCEKDVSKASEEVFKELSESHVTYIGQTWKPMVPLAATYFKNLEKEGDASFGNTVKWNIARQGTWFHKMVVHVVISGLKATSPIDKVKYCSYPGHRIFKELRFTINGNPITSYTSEYYNKYYNFDLETNKSVGWMRTMGQEVPNQAYVTSDPLNNEYREYKLFGDGAQTLKNVQPDLHLFVPLIFYFNKDLGLAFPEIKIPKGQIQIEADINNVNLMFAVVDYGGGGGYVAPTITQCTLHVQHIDTISEIQQQVINNFSFSLIRTPKIQEMTLSKSTDSLFLNNIKYPVESMVAAFRPTENLSNADFWYYNSVLLQKSIYSPVVILDPSLQPTIAINQSLYNSVTDVIQNAQFTINGDLDLFTRDNVLLYTSYYPFDIPTLNTPSDQGWLLFSFQFKPGEKNPNGHLNFTRMRELRLYYDSTYINSMQTAKLIVIAEALNFLVIKDFSAYLKFT